MKTQNYRPCRQSSFFLPDFLYEEVEEGEEGEAAKEVVIKTVGSLRVFIVVSSGNTSYSLWVPITAGNINNIIGNIVRIINRSVCRVVIVKIVIKLISTKLEKEYG